MHECVRCRYHWHEYDTNASGCDNDMDDKYQDEEVECPYFDDISSTVEGDD